MPVRPLVFGLLALAVVSANPMRAAEAPRAPFEGDLLRLSEILGALHYLRDVCDAGDGDRWRKEMQSLIEAEAQDDERKNRMTISFNRGYRVFQQTYRVCTPAAELTIRRYLAEGSKIAREITARYSN